jgi:hypothetical protein
MSNISTIIDTIRTAIPTLSGFSDKSEIPNPYSLTDNDSNFLVNGWGLVVGPSGLSPLNTFKDHSESRTFIITLTKEFVRMEGDNDAIHTDSKALLEDAVLVNKDMLAFDQLEIDANIQKIDFVGNSGIEFIFNGKHSFLATELTYNIDISEELD